MENLTHEINENIDMEHVADSTMDDILPGKIVQGEIVTIDGDYAYVNVGAKTDGRIPLHEFDEKPVIGDVVPVMLQNKRLMDGMFQFSKNSASLELRWKKFMEEHDGGSTTITGKDQERHQQGKAGRLRRHHRLSPLFAYRRSKEQERVRRGIRFQDKKHRQEEKVHRPVPQGLPRRGDRGAVGKVHRRSTSRATSSRARASSTSSSAFSSASRAWTRCCTGTTCPGKRCSSSARS